MDACFGVAMGTDAHQESVDAHSRAVLSIAASCTQVDVGDSIICVGVFFVLIHQIAALWFLWTVWAVHHYRATNGTVAPSESKFIGR